MDTSYSGHFTFAAWTVTNAMLANVEHPKIVQERLDHSDVSMALNRYSHLTMDMQRDAADRLDLLMDGTACDRVVTIARTLRLIGANFVREIRTFL